jgi:lysophospholipase L1-like esterase
MKPNPARAPLARKLLAAWLIGWSFCGPAAAAEHWVATWGASPARQLASAAAMDAAGLEFDGQTLREIVHVSIGGAAVRVRLSNAFGGQPVSIGAAAVAVSSGGSAILPGSSRPLMFGGRPEVTIPPDAPVLSDPVDLEVPAGADLAISLYLPRPTFAAGIHYGAEQTSYRDRGDLVSEPSLPPAAGTLASWAFLSGVDVLAPESAFAVVAFGDSITDGYRSTPDANHRWPDTLAARLRDRGTGPEVGVVDAGIGGNRLLHDAVPKRVSFGVNALARFDRDVLSQPGVRDVIVLEGINDIGQAGQDAPASEAVSAGDIIAALRQLIGRAHERGLRIYGGTLTPFAGTTFPGYFSPEKEVRRQAVNAWIRTSGAFDGVIDFDRAVRDPDHPDRILPAYDGGDHLHPGDVGYRAMAGAVDLDLLK